MEAIEFITSDNYRLKGYKYLSEGDFKGRIIIAGATGVPQGFYRRFALFASERGFETITFDYRGIGESKPATLKGFRMNLLDWGKQDLAAVVESVSQDGVPLYIVGHSYGGHAFGLLPNHHKISGFYVYGTGAGWHGYMPLSEKLKVLTMWNVVLPILTWWKGYCAWRVLGMGEDLPRNVFSQWRHWCRFPHYFFDDPKMFGIEKLYEAVKTPIVAVNVLDDLWALPQSRDAFVKFYANAPVTRVDLHPNALSGAVGHMGYFRKSAEPLWQTTLDWFAGLDS